MRVTEGGSGFYTSCHLVGKTKTIMFKPDLDFYLPLFVVAIFRPLPKNTTHSGSSAVFISFRKCFSGSPVNTWDPVSDPSHRTSVHVLPFNEISWYGANQDLLVANLLPPLSWPRHLKMAILIQPTTACRQSEARQCKYRKVIIIAHRISYLWFRFLSVHGAAQMTRRAEKQPV